MSLGTTTGEFFQGGLGRKRDALDIIYDDLKFRESVDILSRTDRRAEYECRVSLRKAGEEAQKVWVAFCFGGQL